MTSGVLANFQAVQIRALAELTTWLQDENFWSTLTQVFREKWAYTIAEDDIQSAIELAIKPMIDDWRISSIEKIIIQDRQPDSIYLEVVVTSGNQIGKIPLEITA